MVQGCCPETPQAPRFIQNTPNPKRIYRGEESPTIARRDAISDTKDSDEAFEANWDTESVVRCIGA